MKKTILFLSVTFILGFYIHPGYADIVTLSPTVDTYVDAYNPTLSFYNWGTLRVGKDSSNIDRSFLKFDLTGIPDGSIISQADLNLYVYTNSGTREYNLYHVADDNSVTDAMTWNTQPLTNLTYLDVETVSSTRVWKTWDLLAVDQAWNYANDLTDNFVSLRITGNESSGNAFFFSYDVGASTPPILPNLVINYDSSNVPIPGAVWLLGSGLIGIVGIRRKVRQ